MVSQSVEVILSLAGRPLAGCDVSMQDSDVLYRTDDGGALELNLEAGRHSGRVRFQGRQLHFSVPVAAGLRQIRVDIRDDEEAVKDGVIDATMPSTRYKPLKLLGIGGMGLVYKCRDTTLDRIVALKILNEEFAASDLGRELFLTEARTVAGLEHPRLVCIYDLGMHEGRAFLVSQFIDGPNLHELVEARRRLPDWSVAAAGIQLAQGLAAMHAGGVVHQDVKPSNGLVARDGRVYLTDFGLASSLDEVLDPRSKVFGTPAYMSPELIQGSGVAPASDFYSLGSTLFHLATGRVPYYDQRHRMMIAHVVDPVPRGRVSEPAISPALDDAIAAMMAKDPKHRPDARDIVAMLMPVAETIPEGRLDEHLPWINPASISSPTNAVRVGSHPGIAVPSTGPISIGFSLLELDSEADPDLATVFTGPSSGQDPASAELRPRRPSRRWTALAALAAGVGATGLMILLVGAVVVGLRSLDVEPPPATAPAEIVTAEPARALSEPTAAPESEVSEPSAPVPAAVEAAAAPSPAPATVDATAASAPASTQVVTPSPARAARRSPAVRLSREPVVAGSSPSRTVEAELPVAPPEPFVEPPPAPEPVVEAAPVLVEEPEAPAAEPAPAEGAMAPERAPEPAGKKGKKGKKEASAPPPTAF
jgi:serine/threonine-protein kinase